jgi:hypothetical protein
LADTADAKLLIVAGSSVAQSTTDFPGETPARVPRSAKNTDLAASGVDSCAQAGSGRQGQAGRQAGRDAGARELHF